MVHIPGHNRGIDGLFYGTSVNKISRPLHEATIKKATKAETNFLTLVGSEGNALKSRYLYIKGSTSECSVTVPKSTALHCIHSFSLTPPSSCSLLLVPH